MAVGYLNSSGVDFDSLFDAYTTTKAGTGGIGSYYNSAGTHLNDLYEDAASGTAAANVLFYNTFGGDIGPQWAEINSVGANSLVFANDTVSSTRPFIPSNSNTYTFDADGGTTKSGTIIATSAGNDWASDEPNTTNDADWDINVVSITGSGGTLSGTLSTTGIKLGVGGESATLAISSYTTASRVITIQFRKDDGTWSSNYTVTIETNAEA